jgi:hypothetical protein
MSTNTGWRDLTTLPDFNLVYRLRERWGVDNYFATEVERRLREFAELRMRHEYLEQRCKSLEALLPPEVANPKTQQPYRPRRTGD